MSTWTGGVVPVTSARWFEALRDMDHDFRVGSAAMAGVRFAVYGLGSSEYDDDFCRPARDIAGLFRAMGALPLLRVGAGDDSQDIGADFEAWRRDLWKALDEPPSNAPVPAAPSAAEISGCCSGGGGEGNDATSDTSGCCGGSGGATDEGSSSSCGCQGSSGGTEGSDAGGKASGEAQPLSRRAQRKARAKQQGGKQQQGGLAGEAVRMQEDDINERLLREADLLDSDSSDAEEGGGGSSSSSSSRGGASATLGLGDDGAYAGGSEMVDLEDLGSSALLSSLSSSSSSKSSSSTKEARESGDLLTALQGGDEVAVRQSGGGLQLIFKAAEAAAAAAAAAARPEMVTPLQRKALTKEGYKLIGSHSAVKLCRWTKHQLRGRGGCYKHTFYGITSYQCMEATPSLACANKCVFCWRHHKNPVGREWRWKEDPPGEIVEEAVRLHVRMVNEFKGAKGVKPERIAEAFTVRHCALSLVGEPIMYPRINELLGELHQRRISTFLVTNAQFPEQIERLVPVTQLYVSIDAATKESLRAVDRPLFKDFWERFLACLHQLRDKRQRH